MNQVRRAVVTVTIGKTYEFIASMTHKSLRAYANKVGADFVVLDKTRLSSVSPHYEKFQLYHLLGKYDRIVYVDTDAIIRQDCPDMFDIVPYHMIGLVNEGKYQDRSSQMRETCELYGGDFEAYDLGRYYNTGVMVVSRVHKELFEKPEKETVWNFYEQSYLNLRIQELKLRVFDLGHKFNRVSIMDQFTGEHRLASYIVHYAGVLQGLGGLISSDLRRWLMGEYKNMRKRVVVGVGAKLGDNVCAEPVIRYMMEESSDTDFAIATTHPELFSHLGADMVPFDHKPSPEEPFIAFNTTLDEKDPRKRFLTADYMHISDYISLLCIKRQLPDARRQIRLPVSVEGDVEVLEVCPHPKDLILVHPGKSWDSKTFPVEFWKEVIAILSAKNIPVGVIGQYVSKDVGALDFEIPAGAYDFRNLLSLKGLLSAISLAPVLVSNDSAPIHIAGAFDNWIVVVPTCKHPDLILPWRNGSKYYKVHAVFDGLMQDDVRFDPANLYNYDMCKACNSKLPEASRVAEMAIEAYRASKQ